MKTSFVAAICAASIGLMALSSPVFAQQKTVKACEEEWRANKAANQAKGITEKAYVATCRGEAAAATQPASPAASSSPKAKETAAPAAAGQKTVKACEDEWRANKAANQAKGVTEKAYVAECRGGATTAQPTTAPAAQPKTSTAPAAPAAPTARSGPAATTGSAPTGTNQYSSEVLAKAHCLTGTVVWANLDSKIYHFAGHSDYGHTKLGAYMCEKDATAQGMRAAKNEKHP